MSTRPVAAVIAGVALAAVGTACSGTPTVPTESEARARLSAIVGAARSHDFERLCSYGGPHCRDMLRGAGAVPADPPRVTGSRVVPPSGIVEGGIVLKLCGRRADGRPYASEMLFTGVADGRMVATEPVYWSGMRIMDGSVVGAAERTDPRCGGKP